MKNVNLKDLYIDFFVSKGHKEIPSAPVVPENDPIQQVCNHLFHI